jgi:hypothetical protein
MQGWPKKGVIDGTGPPTERRKVTRSERNPSSAKPAPWRRKAASQTRREQPAPYEQAWKLHQQRLESLEKRFGQELSACRTERAETLEAFQKANQAREREFDEERARKEEDQRLGFETLVHRQMQRAERSVGEEFARKGRPPERDI